MSNNQTKYDFAPVPEVFDYDGFSSTLEAFVRTETAFVPGSLVVSLNAPFGSGKTTFLDLWEEDLTKNFQSKHKYRVIRLNAWEDDHANDPLASLVFSIVDALSDKSNSGNLREAAKDVVAFALAIGGQLVTASWINPFQAGDSAKKQKTERQKGKSYADEVWNCFRKRREAMKELKIRLREELNKDYTTTLIMVDELDRCRPDYAIAYLEAIKHVFDIDGLVFVLAVDRGQLETSAKHAFGSELDFNEYYRKFVHREARLPVGRAEKSEGFAAQLCERFLRKRGILDSNIEVDTDLYSHCDRLIWGLSLRPRQALEVLRICGYYFAVDKNERAKSKHTFWLGMFLMAALKVKKDHMYELISKGELYFAQAEQFVAQVWVEKADQEAWLALLSSGGGIRKQDIDQASRRLPHGYPDRLFGLTETGLALQWQNSELSLRSFGEAIEELMAWSMIQESPSSQSTVP